MASPVDTSRIATNQATGVTPLVVNLPASIAAGDTLIMILRANNSGALTTPSGWTALRNASVIGTEVDDDSVLIAWRKADGTEGSTMNVTPGASAKFSAIVWRITGAADPTVNPPEMSTEAFSTGSTTPDPTAVTPSGGAKDYLYLWLGCWSGEQTSPPTTPPTGYSNWTGANSGTTGSTSSNNRCAGGSKATTGSTTENPGSTTISVSSSWTAYTVAIYPVGVQVYTDAATVYIAIQASGTEDYTPAPVIAAQYLEPRIITDQARRSHLRTRKYG